MSRMVCKIGPGLACVVCGRQVSSADVKATCRASSAFVHQAGDSSRALPGTALKALLRDWLGIEAADCGCNDMAALMDSMGPQWCRSHGMPVILNSMRREHQKRRAAGTTSLPWSEFAARRLVLLACQLAGAKNT